jgi:polyisoprenoid-binding protein YceI
MNTLKLSLTTFATLTAIALIGCDNNPTEGASQAAVQEPAQAAEQTPTPPTASNVRYTFSNANSKVEFVGAKVTGKHDGSFGAFTGTVDVVDNAIEKSTVRVEIGAATLVVDAEKLTAHLKSPDFFDVAQYPQVRFRSTAITAGGADGASHTVTGNLELHGVTKAITFPANLRLTPTGAEGDASFGINRKDWNIVYPGMPDDLIKDEVLIKLTIRAARS